MDSAATFAVVVLKLVERLFVLVESEVIDDAAVLALVSRFVARVSRVVTEDAAVLRLAERFADVA